MPRSEITGLYISSVFNILRHCQTVFQSACTILRSHQQNKRILISLQPCQNLFYYRHPSRSDVVAHYGFDFISLNG